MKIKRTKKRIQYLYNIEQEIHLLLLLYSPSQRDAVITCTSA